MVLESAGAVVPGRRTLHDPFTGTQHPISATSHSPRSFATAIRADIGESEAYKQALVRGEIGLQRPMGANGSRFYHVPWTNGSIEIVATDVKTSEIGRFPIPKTYILSAWQAEVEEAVAPGRLNLNDQNLEAQIRSAYQAGHVRLRQLCANYSLSGQGIITGW